MMKDQITQKELNFANYILAGMSKADAAEKAGYTGKTRLAYSVLGCKLMKKPNVMDYIRKQNAQAVVDAGLKAGKVLRDIEETRLLALEKSDLQTATRCSEIQGKHIPGFFAGDKLLIEFPGLQPPDLDAANRARQRIKAIKATEKVLELPQETIDTPSALKHISQEIINDSKRSEASILTHEKEKLR